MADIDDRLQQLVTLLELTSEQKKAIEDLLMLAKQIDQLEATIIALPELQSAVSDWACLQMTLTRRGQPQHGTAEAVVLGKIAINRNAVNLVVADDRLNELITAIRRVHETIRQLCYPTTLLSRRPLTRQSSHYSRRNRRGMNADFFKN